MNRKTAVVISVAVAVLAVAGLFLLGDALSTETAAPKAGGISPASLISSAQTFSTTWIDLGPELLVAPASEIGLWLNVTISDTQNARVRALAKHTGAGADEYVLPILTESASAINVQDEYVELDDDADQKMILFWPTKRVLVYVQFQISAGTVGTTAGQIESAYATIAP